MKQREIAIAGSLASLLVLCGTGGPAGAAEIVCPPGGVLTATSTPSAADVAANSFTNSSCDLTIAATLPSAGMATNLTITAKSVTIDGSGPPAGPVEIINNGPNSGIRITAADGNIRLREAVVKAHKNLNFKCASPGGPDCTFTADKSEIVAASDFAPPLGSGGVLIMDIEGNVDIKDTKVHGGLEWKIFSANGNITLGPCGGGTPGVCEDPNLSLPAIVTAQCGNPIVFPCTLVVNNPDQLRDICFPDVDPVPCNGGFKEKRFEAKRGFIDMRGVTISAHEHMTFWCGPGGFKGAGAKISSHTAELLIDCTFNGGGPVDLTDADLSAPNGIVVKSGGASVITACGASFDGDGSPLYPTLNGGNTPFGPYPSTVVYGPFSVAGGPFNNVTPPANTCPGGVNGAAFD